uniref:Uncharacterized protein n=1 Tax=Nelumbo nucifera TaxID=4432 RepID=A0A822YE42_NELNU|nr:TPA_asm: hypothetical protein HUJ06_011295 [Nelumbo nucifera]
MLSSKVVALECTLNGQSAPHRYTDLAKQFIAHTLHMKKLYTNSVCIKAKFPHQIVYINLNPRKDALPHKIMLQTTNQWKKLG